MLGFLIGGVVLALVVGLLLAYGQRRNRRALLEPADDDRCWLCGSTELETLTRDVRRCRACENVQGDGAARFREGERRAQYAKLAPSRRIELAGRLLEEADLQRIAVEGELQHVLRLSELDRVDAESDGGTEKLTRFATALLAVTALEQKLIDVACVLADSSELERLSVDLSSPRQVLDALDLSGHEGVGFNFAERATHHDIVRAITHLPRLEALHARLAARLGLASAR